MQQVQVEVLGDLAADLDPADAVAVRVERRREDGDAELPGQHREDAAGDAALGRHADVDTHSPAESYMPQVVITLSTRSTYSRSSARSPVTGLTPPLASVAAIRPRSRQSTATEHWRK